MEEGKVRIRQATKQGWAACDIGGCFDISYPSSQLRRGRVQGGGQISPALVTTTVVVRIEIDNRQKSMGEIKEKYRIRKFTPRECFRLMDVSESDIDKMLTSGVSDSQLYRQAGNSIVVAPLYHIFRTMLTTDRDETDEPTLF